MKKILVVLLFICCASLPAFCQPEKVKIEASIAKFFDGISMIDAATLRLYTTPDFTLLEDGHLWNLDTLINKLDARKNAAVKRVNKFQFIKTEQSGKVAWVSYHNTADFSMNEKQQTVNWLESVVMKKDNGTWRIHLMHSTRVVAATAKN